MTWTRSNGPWLRSMLRASATLNTFWRLPVAEHLSMTPFEGWESFYVIVGSSAGALIGLQFVVITLIADMPLRPGDAEASGAFTTPSVIHFAVVLFLSAVLSAPWK